MVKVSKVYHIRVEDWVMNCACVKCWPEKEETVYYQFKVVHFMYFWLSRICLKNKYLPMLLLCSLGTTKNQTENRSHVGKCLYGSEWRERNTSLSRLYIAKVSVFVIKLMIYQTVKIPFKKKEKKDYAANSRVVMTSSRWRLNKSRNLNIVELIL